MTIDVTVVGPITEDTTVLIDRLPDPGGSIMPRATRTAVGGKGANPALAARRWGARVRLVGAVGDDALGAEMLAQLRRHDVDTTAVTRLAGWPTGRVVHLVEPDGRRRFIDIAGANDGLEIDADSLARSLLPRAVVLISTALPGEPALAAAEAGRRAGALVIVDAGGVASTAADVIAAATVVRADAEEARALTGAAASDFDTATRAARALLERGPRAAVVEAGHEGNVVVDGDAETRVELLQTRTVDPTGGGDAFSGTLAALLARGEKLADAARLASAAAGHTVGLLGGTPRFDEQTVRDLAAF